MATDQRNLSAYLAGDTEFRAWIAGLHAQFTACGLVNTSDTGQVNEVTVARPSAGAYGGYKIYRFDDTLQATRPIFIKVEFGVGSAQDRPKLRWQIGSGTNGAGTLTGQVAPSSPYETSCPSSKTAGATLPSYCSGDGSRIALCTHLDASANTFHTFFSVDRGRDASGVAQSNGGVFLRMTQGSTQQYASVPYVGTLPSMGASAADLPTVPISTTSSGYVTVSGTDVAMGPYFCCVGRLYPLMTMAQYVHADIGELVSFTADWMGATRTWMPLGDGGPQGSSNTRATAMIWE